MTNYKEIVTKTVIGKAKKISHDEYKISTEQIPNTVLGCWIINHSFNGTNNNGKVLIKGSFDLNIWYSYDNDTKTMVSNQRVNYTDEMQISLKSDNNLNDNSEIIVRSLKQPTVTDVSIINNEIDLKVEKELGVEVVGDAKLRISVEDEDDDYEIITDDEQNIDEVNDEYIDS